MSLFYPNEGASARIPVSEKLPDVEQYVVFWLKGNPTLPHVGFRDTPEAYVARNDCPEQLTEFTKREWWAEASDQDDIWESRYVTHWCPIVWGEP